MDVGGDGDLFVGDIEDQPVLDHPALLAVPKTEVTTDWGEPN